VQRFDLPLADPSAAAALASAARRARRCLVSRRMFRASVTNHEVVAETYDRVLYNIERRQLIVRKIPGGSGSLRSLPTPEGLDPWGVNPDTVEDDTRVVAACPSCHGAGAVACPTCSGSTWARCSHCIGGKVFSQRKGRLFKNCPYCRGRGTQKCTNCRGGRVGCQHCNASGRVTAWLILDRKIRSHVTVHPRNAAARIHRWITVPDDFDSGAWPTRLSADTGLQPNLKLPSELALALDTLAERVVGARRQTFCTDVHKFTFTTPVGGGRVEVAGEPPVVSPSSRWTGLRTRLALSSVIALLGIWGVVLLYNDYVARHVWYAQHGDVVPLVGFGIGASLLLGLAFAFLLVARAARSWFTIGVSAGAAAAFALGVFLAYTHKQPSIATARSELAMGNLIQAQEEAQALVDMQRDTTGGGLVLDDIHLRRAKELRSFSELIASVREPWHGNGARGDAETLLRTRVQEAATHLYMKHDIDGLGQLDTEIGIALPDMSDGVRWLLAAVRGGALLESADTAAAPAQLDTVVKLAERIPQPMRPVEALQITATATRLVPVLVATTSKSPRDRVKALVAAVEPAREYARLLGMDPNIVAQGLAFQQKEATRALVRAERWAQQRAARDRGALATQPQPSGDAAGAPIDPYTDRNETVDGEAAGSNHER
jgi:hypothetical protein